MSPTIHVRPRPHPAPLRLGPIAGPQAVLDNARAILRADDARDAAWTPDAPSVCAWALVVVLCALCAVAVVSDAAAVRSARARVVRVVSRTH